MIEAHEQLDFLIGVGWQFGSSFGAYPKRGEFDPKFTTLEYPSKQAREFSYLCWPSKIQNYFLSYASTEALEW
ncbi:hypothetical protein AAHA92_07507 [Salvia divinorum]|uniref:Uncharacterized protein n=1 Tax=Salvia divinorum TaxID=28513 RepID=A0ABD1ICP3_SALDI